MSGDMGDKFVVAKIKGFPWWPAKVHTFTLKNSSRMI